MKLKLYEEFSDKRSKGFKSGDRVIYVYKGYDYNDECFDYIGHYDLLDGATGTLLSYYSDDENTWSVRFDEKFELGHNCEGRCEDGYGYHVDEFFLELLEKQQTPIIRWYKKGKLTKE